jgi:hypothetical protein
MTINSIPYVYSLSFIDPKTNTKRWYIGVQYGKNCNPENLWLSYFTSSKVIKSLLNEYGPKSFKTKIIKTFTTEVSARAYEERFIRKAINLGLKLNIQLINRGIPNKNFAHSMKGRKYEEIFDPITCNNLKTNLRKPKTKEALEKMVLTRIKNGSYYTGKQHAMARRFKIISPDKTEFTISGTLKSFCEQHNLSWQTLYSHIDKGIIVLDRTKHKNIKRLTIKFWNSIGWQINSF